MSMPRATLRIQFHKNFTFADATALVRYFAALGVSHLYASPIMTARPGSTHGYDTIDVETINPELGGEDGLRILVRELRRHEMGLILDIVPNHMAVGDGNAWWIDVLARGRASHYAEYFDIDWEPSDPHLRGKVLLPVLGRPYGEALGAGEISLRQNAAGVPIINYFDRTFPLADASIEEVKDGSPAVFNAATAAGREQLHRLLEAQHYRIAWWRSGNDQINWRRFFEINDLAALREENDEVFERIHATISRLYAEGWIDGLRIDHVDGLAQPEAYCGKLRARLAALELERPAHCRDGRAYIVVEKILAADEKLPDDWNTDGTTGYDFMDEINALQQDAAGEKPLTEWWGRISGRTGEFAVEELLARRQILAQSFSAQCESAVDAFLKIAQHDLATRDFARPALRRCLIEIVVHFPVYRIYTRLDCTSEQDRRFLLQAVAGAKTTCLPSDAWLIDVLAKWLLGEQIGPQTGAIQALALTRFQQLTAPLCAKAVEDTAFYRYGRLISRNDVGFDARRFSLSVAEFHDRMRHRGATLQHSMLATATHDHKRGEDVRARLAVLSELSADWISAVEGWIQLSSSHRDSASDNLMPSRGDLAILFQTIVGSWPIGLTPSDAKGIEVFGRRVAAWQQKALREAKLHTDWAVPNDEYERAANQVVSWLFSGSSAVLLEIAQFATRVTEIGVVNSLSQLVAKLTVPGVPDIYQGTEFWDLSLVDPDNRAPVDFGARQRALDAQTKLAPYHLTDPRTKQLILVRILAVRKRHPELFAAGTYLPLQIDGPFAEHVVAFARVLDDVCTVTIFCRLIAHLTASVRSFTTREAEWSATKLIVPAEVRGEFSNSLSPGQQVTLASAMSVGDILGDWPVAFLIKTKSIP
jgi:(1->4)-alpha-D-glucan 1-alpha-D-glucosylmutase